MQTFSEWNKGELDSYLIEITADIAKFRDNDGKHLLDKILDAAGQKGTGKWTAISALEYGMPLTLIGNLAASFCEIYFHFQLFVDQFFYMIGFHFINNIFTD